MGDSLNNRLLLLGILRRSEMHGYGLMEYLETALTACTDLKKPTAYYLLKRLAHEGLAVEETIQDGPRPPRRVYRLSPAGEAEFQTLLRRNLAENAADPLSGDVGLAFLDALPPAEGRAALVARRAQLDELLAQTEASPPHHGSVSLVLAHRRHYLQSEIAWLDHLLKAESASLLSFFAEKA
jgi:DNA-binding PadR family transcriptional regulator